MTHFGILATVMCSGHSRSTAAQLRRAESNTASQAHTVQHRTGGLCHSEPQISRVTSRAELSDDSRPCRANIRVRRLATKLPIWFPGDRFLVAEQVGVQGIGSGALLDELQFLVRSCHLFARLVAESTLVKLANWHLSAFGPILLKKSVSN